MRLLFIERARLLACRTQRVHKAGVSKTHLVGVLAVAQALGQRHRHAQLRRRLAAADLAPQPLGNLCASRRVVCEARARQAAACIALPRLQPQPIPKKSSTVFVNRSAAAQQSYECSTRTCLCVVAGGVLVGLPRQPLPEGQRLGAVGALGQLLKELVVISGVNHNRNVLCAM